MDYLYQPITKNKYYSNRDKTLAHMLGLSTVYDILRYFPLKSSFQKTDKWVTVNHSERHKNHSMLTLDIMHNGKISYRKYPHHVFLICFKGRLIKYFTKYINIKIFLEPKDIKVLKYPFLRLTGLWNSRHRCLFISLVSGYGVGNVKYYHPLHISYMGDYPKDNYYSEESIQKLVCRTYLRYHSLIKDILPKDIRQKNHFFSTSKAIWECHFPSDLHSYHKARRTLRYTELYQYASRLYMSQRRRYSQRGFAINTNRRLLYRFLKYLPYKLTPDQIKCTEDIMYDMRQDYQMNRLLQGDVGSGKTIVAACAALMAIKQGYQVAIMVPTTVLAHQHIKTFKNFFKHFDISIALLTGHTSGNIRAHILQGLSDGSLRIVIGTEALYSKDTNYFNLGLVVIDEQQKFGVNQKARLKDKVCDCNVLSMTATPIPRSLISVLYGAIDISQIHQLPKGRVPTHTVWLKPSHSIHDKIMTNILASLKKHGQTIIITKLVHHSRKNVLSNVFTTYKLISRMFSRYNINIEYIYGSMSANAKNKVLSDFVYNRCQILVATTVIGVGIDSSHANNIIILNADTYGLAQLHQLRGRVGRNHMPSTCLLIADPSTKQGAKRMDIMAKYHNGFIISQKDLKLRGGGNLLSKQQSGMPRFPMANLNKSTDFNLFKKIQKMLLFRKSN